MVKQNRRIGSDAVSKRSTLPIAESEIDVLKLMVKSTLGKKDRNQSPITASFGDIHVNFNRHELFKNGKRIPANARELRLLKYFFVHEGEVLSRNQLLQDVWGFENSPSTRSIDNYVLRLRKKIEDDYQSPRYILTVYSVGYQFKR